MIPRSSIYTPSLFDQTEPLASGQFGASPFGSMGQTQPDPHQGTILHSAGRRPALEARHALQMRQREAFMQQELRRMQSEWDVSAPQRALRAVLGQPPIITAPRSSGPQIRVRGERMLKKHPEWQDDRYASDVIRLTFDDTGGLGAYYGNNGTSQRVGSQGIFYPNAHGHWYRDTEQKSVDKYWVGVNSASGYLKFSNSNISDRDLINYFLGNMITGRGPENYIFPTDGVVSERAAKGETFKKAIKTWYSIYKEAIKNKDYNRIKSQNFKVDYNAPEQLKDLLRDGTFLTMPNFIASAWATIDPIGHNKIKITVFNVSSLTSGDGMKHAPWNEYSLSVPRRMGKPTEWGSISTTFSVTRSVDWAYFVDESIERWRTINRH